jgi:hypothetical protein
VLLYEDDKRDVEGNFQEGNYLSTMPLRPTEGGGVNVNMEVLLTSALVGGKWLVSRANRCNRSVLIGYIIGRVLKSAWATQGIEHSCLYRDS